MKYQTRRGFLTASGGALAALGLGSIGCGPDEGIVDPPGPIEDTLENTLEIKLSDHTFGTKSFGTIKARLRTYGGQLPGPTIYTHPGDTLKFLVRNNLPMENPDDHHAWMQVPLRKRALVPHMFNHTNLHVHGVETIPHLFEPLGTSDPKSSMISIGPGQEYSYSFPIPKDHAPGLYWYHPHHHGSTAVQVLNGMAGGLIIKGAIDEVAEIKAAQEHTIVVQDVGLFKPMKDDEPWMYSPTQNAIWQTFQDDPVLPNGVKPAIVLKDKDGNVTQVQGDDGNQYTPMSPGSTEWKKNTDAKRIGAGFSTGDLPLHLFLVNGTLVYEETHNPVETDPPAPIGHQHDNVPRYKLQPGEVVRFRFLNGCSDNMIPLVVEGHEMHVIAMDGVNFPAPRKRKMVQVNQDPTLPATVLPQAMANAQAILGPANRVEFLIKASSKPGVYGIYQNAHRGQFIQSAAKLLAEIEVLDGAPKDMPLPTKLPVSSRHYPLIPDGNHSKLNIVFGLVFPSVYNDIVGVDFFMSTITLKWTLDQLKNPTLWEGSNPAENQGYAYVEERVDWNLEVGKVYEWTIQDNSYLGMHGSTEGHPFHQHATSFEVIKINGVAVPPEEITIQDTVWVPHMETVTIRMRHRENAIGKFVAHCHILPHEDCGMMMNILVAK